ncbi:hypothetical protein F5B21DRAFT_499894 [Xylaria acuta]|nr:hypothetical protein F5B21DRAFT_499894 [Xylaria acuta]
MFYTLIARLVSIDTVCIGTSSANRSGEMMQSVGLYLNLLPLLFRTELNQTFTNALKTLRDKSLAAFIHSQVSFDVVLNELQVPRSSSHSPLSQVLVNYRAWVSETRTFCNCESKIIQFNQGKTPYDLSLDIIDNPGGGAHVNFGRLHSNAGLALRGRISGDTQVKLRGILIDLGEIESAILSTGKGQVFNVAVTVRDSKATGSEFLAAFIIALDPVHDDSALENILQSLPLP